MNLSECATRGCGLIEIYRESLIDNGPLPAITDYGSGKTMTYTEVARRIARLPPFF